MQRNNIKPAAMTPISPETWIRFSLSILVLFFFNISCVSVNLGPGELERSKQIQFKHPNSPFIEIDMKGADRAWQNPHNGNTISFFSSCDDPGDPNLLSLENDMLSGFEKINKISSNITSFNGRQAQQSVVEGDLDGVRMHIDLIVFKKNKCNYSLNYVGVQQHFADNEAQYQEFLKSFEAP